MALKKFTFNVTEIDNQARTGLIETHRGSIRTRLFLCQLALKPQLKEHLLTI